MVDGCTVHCSTLYIDEKGSNDAGVTLFFKKALVSLKIYIVLGIITQWKV